MAGEPTPSSIGKRGAPWNFMHANLLGGSPSRSTQLFGCFSCFVGETRVIGNPTSMSGQVWHLGCFATRVNSRSPGQLRSGFYGIRGEGPFPCTVGKGKNHS